MAKICNETLSSKLLDDLTYKYNNNGASNQLYCVTDFGLDRPDFPDFPRNTSTAQAYWYDDNGNLRQDNIKGLADIDYNYLNLPIRIKGTASGQKIRKKLFLNTNYTSEIPKEQMDYAGRAIYKGRVLRYIQTGEGRIVYNSSTRTYSWQYDIKDHLGNTRAVVAQTKEGQPTVLQQTHYYPFGLEMPGMGVGSTREEQPYLYNGKESINDLDLGWYDYGARMYDASLGRWGVVDPLVQFPSSYTAVANNPVRYSDPDGMAVTAIEGGYKITGDDIAVYLMNIETASSGQATWTNFYESLNAAASNPESNAFKNSLNGVNVTPTGSNSNYNRESGGSQIHDNNARAKLRESQNQKEKEKYMTEFNKGREEMTNGTFMLMGMFLSPLAAAEAPSCMTLKYAGYKMGASAASQYAFNSKVDLVDMISDGFLTPGVGSVVKIFNVDMSATDGLTFGTPETLQEALLITGSSYVFGTFNGKLGNLGTKHLGGDAAANGIYQSVQSFQTSTLEAVPVKLGK